jgi:hypothetical protein
VLAALAGTAGWAGQNVIVCMERNAELVVLNRAQALAGKIFEEIGVRLAWHDPRSCPARSIPVRLSMWTPPESAPEALASTRPYRNAGIVVFYDRLVRIAAPSALPIMLGHVLAHEIAHMLQGIAWHSGTGIMKERYTTGDQSEMMVKPFRFGDRDVFLIRQGLERRTPPNLASAASPEGEAPF